MAIEKLVSGFSSARPEPRPFFVWFHEKSDDKTNCRLEQSVFVDPYCVMFLLPFRCLKIDLEAIRDPALRESHGPAPRFMILDPRGREVGRISGKRTLSIAATVRFLRKAWPDLFTLERKIYRVKMSRSFGREDAILSRETVLRVKRQRLKLREPSEDRDRKVKAIKKAAAETAKLRAAMEKDRRVILALCVLRKECRAPEPKPK